jgi:hypothetical protein
MGHERNQITSWTGNPDLLKPQEAGKALRECGVLVLTAFIALATTGCSGLVSESTNPGPSKSPLQITTASLPGAQTQAPYQASLAASGGTSPYSWSLRSGSLPPGLSLAAASGMISGTPTQSGNFSFTVQVKDSSSPAQTATSALSITITSQPPATSATLYIGGVTESTQFPVTNGSIYQGSQPGWNGTLSSLSVTTAQTSLAFGSYFGSTPGAGYGSQTRAIWRDPATGDIFFGGRGISISTTVGVFQPNNPGSNSAGWICRYSATGTKKWCSYIGLGHANSEDAVYGIAGIGSDGNLVICGRMFNQPTGANFDGVSVTRIGPSSTGDGGWMAKVKPDGSTLLWFTNFGGSSGNGNRGRCIYDKNGQNIYGEGDTLTNDFPVTTGAFQTTNNAVGHAGNGESGVVYEMRSDGTAFVWASYLGGSNDDHTSAEGGIALDSTGDNIYISGAVQSPNFMQCCSGQPDGYQKSLSSITGSAAEIVLIKGDGTQVLHSTFYSGTTLTTLAQTNFPNNGSQIDGITLDAGGNVIVKGVTCFADQGITANVFQTTNKYCNPMVARFSPDLSTLMAATFIGGTGSNGLPSEWADVSSNVAIDSVGNVWTVSNTSSPDFPVTANAYSRAYSGLGGNTAIWALSPDLKTLVYGSYLGGPVSKADYLANAVFGFSLAP